MAEFIRAMERLEHLCKVLGTNYEDRLQDVGIVDGQEPDAATSKLLDENVRVLEATTISRFDKLKELGPKLRDLWKSNDTPATEIVKFSEALLCFDAVTVNELTGEKSLSTSLITKVNDEIKHLEKSKVVKLQNKYIRKKNKLLKLMNDSHLLPSQFNFDPEQVVSDFPEATANLKAVIEQVKLQSLARKDTVMRTEVLLECVDQGLCAKTSETLLHALKSILSREDGFLFDGKDIKIQLNEIERRIKAQLELPVKKRASARLRDRENAKGDTAEVPPPPYPSGIRGGHRTRQNQAWGKAYQK